LSSEEGKGREKGRRKERRKERWGEGKKEEKQGVILTTAKNQQKTL
jgi:hypothetical protein